MARTLIDTRLWVLALKRKLYPADSPERELGDKARAAILAALASDDVLVSGQLLAEIYSVCTERGVRLKPEVAQRYLRSLLAEPRVAFSGTRPEDYRAAIDLSRRSGVHIWDFLVVLPFRNQLDRILTMDPHFQHQAFAPLGRVENPLGVWKVEGQR